MSRLRCRENMVVAVNEGQCAPVLANVVQYFARDPSFEREKGEAPQEANRRKDLVLGRLRERGHVRREDLGDAADASRDEEQACTRSLDDRNLKRVGQRRA
jgi:hypothetical protein